MAFFVDLVVLFILSGVAKALYELWLRPLRVRRMMAQQGIRGPPPHFFYGNNREVAWMKKEAREKPMNNLSHAIFPTVMPHITAWTAMYGKNYLNWHGVEAQLVISDPELIKEVLLNKEKVFHKAPATGFMKKILGDGLVTSEGDKWVSMRKLANHAFHNECLKNMVPDMASSARMMLERWKDYEGREIEVFKDLTILTSEAISRTAFGSSYMEGRIIFEMLTKLSMLAAKNAFRVQIPLIGIIWKTADQAEADRLEEGIRHAVMQVIMKREEKVKAGDIDGLGNDFLGMLVEALHDTDKSKRITIDNIVDECKTFYIAGQETTNTTLAWTMFLLAVHPDWQEKARKEVFDIFGNEDPNADGIPRLRTVRNQFHYSFDAQI
ncbi:hypothetical protein MLD38_011476 [Melastoma candidum]|uniref:Uncharacterized protein n=1 Tax=Melastoma candidum TaxID=119954 RepID=A0ACB9R4A9_9MYRT|nr:hypothetical protein MLD38_011476 [Melastoma candidum]